MKRPDDREAFAGQRWTALPEDAAAPVDDSEAAIRAWERLQRLDREQRGNS